MGKTSGRIWHHRASWKFLALNPLLWVRLKYLRIYIYKPFFPSCKLLPNSDSNQLIIIQVRNFGCYNGKFFGLQCIIFGLLMCNQGIYIYVFILFVAVIWDRVKIKMM